MLYSNDQNDNESTYNRVIPQYSLQRVSHENDIKYKLFALKPVARTVPVMERISTLFRLKTT